MSNDRSGGALLSRYWFVAVLIVVALGLAAALMWVERTSDVTIALPQIPIPQAAPQVRFRRHSIGQPHSAPRVTNIQILDFDGDEINDLLVCDAARDSVLCYRQHPLGTWTEMVLADELKIPAHATIVDIDRDGDSDIIVSVLGDLFPSDKLIGKVVLLEKQDDGSFERHTLLDGVRRVSDVQGADFDGDGDVDLAVAVFGYARGELLWLENRGPREFRKHQLLFRPGIIHVPVGDLDQDGDADIAAIVSQDEEELWVFDNRGGGEFRRERIYFSNNVDVGSAGLVMSDLDGDGDLDLLLPQGDDLEDVYAWPQPYHGCLWIENQGDWQFQTHRLAQFGGTYAAAAGDIDGDGDLDVTLVSMANDWGERRQASIVWLENRDQQFHTWSVDTDPIRLVTVACGDLNGDGRADLVAGGLFIPPPGSERIERITAWISEESAMRRWVMLLVALLGIELVCLVIKLAFYPAPPNFPAVDLTLLDDPISFAALTDLQRETDRSDWQDWKQLGEYYFAFGYYRQAEMCFRVSQQMKPGDGLLHLLRAISLDRMGDKRTAIDEYRQAITAGAPHAESYRIRIAQCLLALGDEKAAESQLRQLDQLPEARILLSRMLIRDGRAGEARSLLEALRREFRHGIEPHSLACWAAEEEGDWKAAEELQNHALRAREGIFRRRLVRDEDVRLRQRYSTIRKSEQ